MIMLYRNWRCDWSRQAIPIYNSRIKPQQVLLYTYMVLFFFESIRLWSLGYETDIYGLS